ncbi:MAG TPA: hypothetical protein VM221_08560 [Armatimonadota bacterium]|nr:hypothetical protein [Armatimonadota bacterium]
MATRAENAPAEAPAAILLAAVGRLRRRARWLRAERAASRGLAAGLGLGAAVRLLEIVHLVAPAAWWYAAVALVPAVAAWAWSFTHPPGALAVAAAADERLGIKDRSASAVALGESAHPMTAALIADAAEHITAAPPRRVFKRRLGRRVWPPAAAGAALALAIFLPQWPALQSAQARTARAERRAQAQQLEDLAAELERRADPTTEDLARQVAENLRRLGRDLRSPAMTEKRAVMRLKETAAQLAAARAQIEQDSPKSLAQAGAELSRLAEQQVVAKQADRLRDLRDLAQLKQAGLKEVETLEQLAELPAQDFEKFKHLPQLKGLSEEQMRRLAELAKRERARQLYANLELPQDLLDALSELFAKEDYLSALELMQTVMEKLGERLEAQQAGKAPPLTDEELKRLQAELKELAELLKNTNLDQLAQRLRATAERLSRMDIEELLKRLKECESCAGCQGCRAGLGLLPGLGAGMGLVPGVGSGIGPGIGPGDSRSRYQPGMVDRPTGSPQRTTVPLSDVNIRGQFGDRGDVAATEVYVPPSSGGERGKVPYFRVLPSYRERAEDALRREEVPPEQRARVKRYFDALTAE